MNDAVTLEQLQRRKRRWLLLLWCCGVLFALSTIIGLGASLSRVKKTVEMAEALSESAYEAMIEATFFQMKMGFFFGSVTFLCYLYCALMHYRAKRQLQSALDENRDLAIREALLEPIEEMGK